MPEATPNSAPPNSAPDFTTLIPEEFRSHPSLSPIKDMNGLVKSFISAQEMIGKNKVVLPGETSTDKDWDEFYGKLGRPEAPEKYGLEPPKDLPGGATISPDYLKTLGVAFHKAGLTDRQAKALFNELNTYATAELTKESEQATVQQQNEMAKLRTDFGAQFDIKMDAAKRAVATFVPDNLKEWATNDPNMLRIFADIGMKLAEHGTEGGEGSGGGFSSSLSPSQAQAQINEKTADAEFMKMYTDQYHPKHAWAVEQMTNLFKLAYPQKSASSG